MMKWENPGCPVVRPHHHEETPHGPIVMYDDVPRREYFQRPQDGDPLTVDGPDYPPVVSRGLQRWVIVAVFLLGLIVGAGLALAWPSRAGATSPSVWVGVPSFVPVPRSAQATSTAVPAWVPAASGTPELSRTPVPSASPSPTRTRPAATVKPPTAQPSVTPSFGKHRTSGLATWFDDGPGLYAAAGPSLRRAIGSHWRGTIVTVCSRSRCVDGVILSDFCACGPRHGKPTALDLSLFTFSRFTAPGRGVIEVIVSW